MPFHNGRYGATRYAEPASASSSIDATSVHFHQFDGGCAAAAAIGGGGKPPGGGGGYPPPGGGGYPPGGGG